MTINPGDALGLRLHPDLGRSKGCSLEQPNEGTMLCAVWWRQIASPQHGDPEQVLGFRVPLQLWDEAFAAASASLDR